MKQRSSYLSLLIIILVLLTSAFLVLKIDPSRVSAQTIPTRTPTPSGGGATPTSQPDEPGPNPTALPTSTRRPPQPTATHTPVPIPPTPEEGFLATALPCASDPMLRSLASGANMRSGPGLDYEIVGNLLLNEVRPIVGRAAQARWWQTVLADSTVAWISDSLVSISGYIGNVPIVDAPALENGATVTPGAPWAPTPQPSCTPPPSATPTATLTVSPTPASTATGETVQDGQAAANGDTGQPANGTPDTTQPTPSAIATVAATTTSSPTVTISIPTAAPLPGETEVEDNAGFPWLPVVGSLLILSAVGIFAIQRLRP